MGQFPLTFRDCITEYCKISYFLFSCFFFARSFSSWLHSISFLFCVSLFRRCRLCKESVSRGLSKGFDSAGLSSARLLTRLAFVLWTCRGSPTVPRGGTLLSAFVPHQPLFSNHLSYLVRFLLYAPREVFLIIFVFFRATRLRGAGCRWPFGLGIGLGSVTQSSSRSLRPCSYDLVQPCACV